MLTAATGYHVVADPCPVLVLLPTQDDCRDYVVSDVERLFDASPRLRKRLSGPKAGSDRINRNTLTHRLFKAAISRSWRAAYRASGVTLREPGIEGLGRPPLRLTVWGRAANRPAGAR